MKKKLLFLMVLAASFSYVSAQSFHEDDKEGLRRFLRQESPAWGKSNFEITGLTAADTLKWQTSEEWIEKMYNTGDSECVLFTEWSDNSTNKRLVALEGLRRGFNNQNFAGKLDCSLFTQLERLSMRDCRLTEVDVSKNTKLTKLDLFYNQSLQTLDVSQNTALTSLDCSYNQLTALDVSNNAALTSLSCSVNRLTALDVSNNAALTSLSCSRNLLTALDVSNNAALTGLYCSSNRLTALDVSNNAALTSLDCPGNQLTALDVSNNAALTHLSCSDNQLTVLDVSKNTALTRLSCSVNQLTALDVSKNTALTGLSCSYNQLTTLDLSNNPALWVFDCRKNQLTALDVSKNTELTGLNCSDNQLTALDVSKNPDLREFHCFDNQLTALDVSKNVALYELVCYHNQLTALDVLKNAALTALDCSRNQLTALDVSKNTALTYFFCNYNQLTALDVSKNTELTNFFCNYNQLTALDVSNNVALTDLYCFNNQLTALDVSKNTALARLNCPNNQLTALDVSKNTELIQLRCYKNQLTALDVSKNTKLYYLDTSGNYFKFSTLPTRSSGNFESHTFAPQKYVDSLTVAANSVIDLSSEYDIRGKVTGYSWHEETEPYTLVSIELTELDNGKFIADEKFIGKTLVCKMINAQYPNLELTHKVKIFAEPGKSTHLNEHLRLINPSAENVYSVAINETFTVEAPASMDANLVKIGLFTQTNILRKRIDVSNNGSTYTCQVPAGTVAGNYLIQPYIVDSEGKVKLIERPANSIFIDKLPINVGTATRSYEPTENATVSKHLQIKTAENFKHVVALEETFQVYAPTTDVNARIGMFDLYSGDFISDITLSRNNYTYTCAVPFDQYADEYVIMPYIVEDGKEKAVERSKGAVVMDRLPLVVEEEDIWGLRNTDTSRNAPVVYPTQVAKGETINIDIPQSASNVEVFSLTGQLVSKHTNVKGSIAAPMQSGTYIVRITTDGKIVSKRIVVK